MEECMQLFSFLAAPLGIAMSWIYTLLQNYGWTIIVFTILVRVAVFPLTIKQQKSTAKMAAYQPMIDEIRKKWANDKNKQNAEMQKFHEENNLNMTAGCLPMVVNMLVLFGIIAVIQAPLNYVLSMPQDQIDNAVAIVENYNPDMQISKSAYSMQSMLVGEMRNPDTRQHFLDGIEVKDAESGKMKKVAVTPEWVQKVDDFNFHFLGMDLSKVPTKVPRSELPIYLILPILSVLTMFGSQFIMAKTSGNAAQMKGSMMVMTVVMGLWFGYIAFTISVGFSLYYAISNLVMTGQQLIVKRIYDPEKIKIEVQQEIEERKKAKKAKKVVAVKQSDGAVTEQEVTEAELAKLRLQRAREIDAERYAAEETESQKEAAKKAREIDDDKYQKNIETKMPENEKAPKETEEIVEAAADKIEPAEENEEHKSYKPGRRKRARGNKDQDDSENKT